MVRLQLLVCWEKSNYYVPCCAQCLMKIKWIAWTSAMCRTQSHRLRDDYAPLTPASNGQVVHSRLAGYTYNIAKVFPWFAITIRQQQWVGGHQLACSSSATSSSQRSIDHRRRVRCAHLRGTHSELVMPRCVGWRWLCTPLVVLSSYFRHLRRRLLLDFI